MNFGAEASVTNDLVAVTQLELWPPRQVFFKPCHTAPSWCSFHKAVTLGRLSQGQPGCLRSLEERETRARKPCLRWPLWASVCNDSSLWPCFNKGYAPRRTRCIVSEHRLILRRQPGWASLIPVSLWCLRRPLDCTLTRDKALNFSAISRGLEHKWLSSSVDPWPHT